MERPKNYAPEMMEGEYLLNVKDNKIIVTKHYRGFDRNVVVKCAPEDEFNIYEGVKIAMQRLQEDRVIRVGDVVEIVNPGCSYADLSITEIEDVPFEYVARYRYGVIPKTGKQGNVVYISNKGYIFVQVSHEKYEGNTDYKNLPCWGGVYCLSCKALKKIKDGRF